MSNLKNFFKVFAHTMLRFNSLEHMPEYTYIDDERHYYCSCGYMKPERVRVNSRD